jgi:hypothetical protein
MVEISMGIIAKLYFVSNAKRQLNLGWSWDKKILLTLTSRPPGRKLALTKQQGQSSALASFFYVLN